MTSPDDNTPLPPQALFLKRLVVAMAVVMIAGFIALIVTLIAWLPGALPVMPPEITLPDGIGVTAFTQGVDWYAVVTDDDRILIFDRMTGVLRQTVAITR